MNHRPSPIAGRIVDRLIPDRWRLSVQGDLEEEYGRAGATGGRLRRLAATLEIALRLAPFRFRPGPEGGGEPAAGRSGSLTGDIRYGIRMLRKHPVSSLAAVLTLGLGIGANLAMYGVVDGVLLEPLPFPEEDRVVRLRLGTDPAPPGGLPDYLIAAIREGAGSLQSLSTFSVTPREVSAGREPEAVAVVSGQTPLLEVLGTPLAAGSVDPSESETILIATHAWFSSRLGGDPSRLGELIQVGSGSHPLRGVLPPGVHFPDLDAQLLMLAPPPPGGVQLPSGGGNRVSLARDVVARLRPGVSLENSAVELQGVTDSISAIIGSDRPARLRLIPLRESMVGDVRPALLALLASLGLVLLIAAANVAHMLLARLRGRAREMAVRTVMGAGRTRLYRQLTVESFILAGLGGAAGVVAAAWGLSLLVTARPEDLPRPDAVGLDASAVLVAAVLTLSTGLAFALLSGLQLDRSRLWVHLKQGEQLSGGRSQNRLGRTLLVAEVACATLLLICAGLTLNSFVRLTRSDMGYVAEGLLTASLPRFYTTVTSEDGSERLRLRPLRPFIEPLMQRLKADPRVDGVGLALGTPFGTSRSTTKLTIPGVTAGEERTSFNVVTPGYFPTIAARLLEGALFTDSDIPQSEPVVVINESFRRRYFPGASPVGRQIVLGQDPARVVGVVADIKRGTFGEDAEPEAFESLLQHETRYWGVTNLVVRLNLDDPEDFIPELRALGLEIDSEGEFRDVASLESRLYASAARPRFYALLGLILSSVATVLVGVGLYGLVSFAASTSRRAVAIRIALGARPRDVIRESVRGWMALVAAGGVIGVAAGVLASRSLMTIELFRIDSTDPVTYALVVALLMAVAFVASWIPARRAARLDPVQALRAE